MANTLPPLTSAHGAGAPGAGRVGRVHVPGVVGGRVQWRLPGHVAPIVSSFHLHLDLHLHLQVGVVLRHGPGVRALLVPDVHVMRVRGIHHLVPLLPVQQEPLEWHRVLLGQEERRLRDVLARWVHLPGALQVEQDAGPAGVVHVPVVLQQLLGEQTLVPEADGLRGRGEDEAAERCHLAPAQFSKAWFLAGCLDYD